MSGDGAGLAGQRQRGALGDDRAERVPAGLDHDVGVEPGDECGSHRHGKLGAPDLDLWRGALPHPRVDEHLVAEAGQQRPQRTDVDRNRVAPLQARAISPAPSVRTARSPSSPACPSKAASANAIPRRVVAGRGSSWITTP